MIAKQTPADSILKSIDTWVRWAFRGWALERDIECYANGGPPPTDDPDFENNIVPLGFAQSFMKREMAPLLDALLLKPGMIDAKLITPALNIPERTMAVQDYLNETINKIVMPKLSPEITNAAGRATVTGRAVLYRRSPNSLDLKCGRIIHPPEYPLDTLSSEFREWAFPGTLSLEDIENRLRSSAKGKYGWNREGLEQLKLWIMATESLKFSTNSELNSPEWVRSFSRDGWLEADITRSGFAKPVDVYWYFRKNGKITKNDPRFGGHEGVDLYCVSRYGSEKAVMSSMKDAFTKQKEFTITYNNDFEKHLDKLQKKANGDFSDKREKNCNERLLFYCPDVFKSIDECLILHIDDAAVSGEQKLSEVRGTGKVAMPKLAVMEQLLTSIIEGLTFGAQPNWSVSPGVPDEYLQQLERGGLRSGQAFPTGINPMAKQNSFTGFSHAMGFIQLLDAGVSADSSANNQGTFGGSKAEFAIQANAEMTNRQQAMNRRFEGWLLTLDKVSEMIARTLCRAWPEMRQEYPCYYDAQRLRLILRTRYGVHEDEWDQERWDFSARRLAGGMMRQQAVAFNTSMLQIVGPHEPTLIPMFIREIIRSGYGDTIANQWLNPPEEAKLSQTTKAQNNVAIAFVTGQVPPVSPADNAAEHSKVAAQVVEGRIKAAMATGSVTTAEVIGVLAIIQYAAQHMMRLPQQWSDPGMARLEEFAKAIQSIPVQQPTPEDALTPKDMAELQLKGRNQERLLADQQLKQRKLEVDQMIAMRKLSNAEEMQSSVQKNLATDRARATVEIQSKLNESEQYDPFAV